MDFQDYHELIRSTLAEMIVHHVISDDELNRIAIIHIPIDDSGRPRLINIVLDGRSTNFV